MPGVSMAGLSLVLGLLVCSTGAALALLCAPMLWQLLPPEAQRLVGVLDRARRVRAMRRGRAWVRALGAHGVVHQLEHESQPTWRAGVPHAEVLVRVLPVNGQRVSIELEWRLDAPRGAWGEVCLEARPRDDEEPLGDPALDARLVCRGGRAHALARLDPTARALLLEAFFGHEALTQERGLEWLEVVLTSRRLFARAMFDGDTPALWSPELEPTVDALVRFTARWHSNARATLPEALAARVREPVEEGQRWHAEALDELLSGWSDAPEVPETLRWALQRRDVSLWAVCAAAPAVMDVTERGEELAEQVRLCAIATLPHAKRQPYADAIVTREGASVLWDFSLEPMLRARLVPAAIALCGEDDAWHAVRRCMEMSRDSERRSFLRELACQELETPEEVLIAWLGEARVAALPALIELAHRAYSPAVEETLAPMLSEVPAAVQMRVLELFAAQGGLRALEATRALEARNPGVRVRQELPRVIQAIHGRHDEPTRGALSLSHAEEHRGALSPIHTAGGLTIKERSRAR